MRYPSHLEATSQMQPFITELGLVQGTLTRREIHKLTIKIPLLKETSYVKGLR
jgi:hypothetical protein